MGKRVSTGVALASYLYSRNTVGRVLTQPSESGYRHDVNQLFAKTKVKGIKKIAHAECAISLTNQVDAAKLPLYNNSTCQLLVVLALIQQASVALLTVGSFFNDRAQELLWAISHGHPFHQKVVSVSGTDCFDDRAQELLWAIQHGHPFHQQVVLACLG